MSDQKELTNDTNTTPRGGNTALDRTAILVDPKAYQDFLERLDAPPQPNERLLATMRAPVPWDMKKTVATPL